MFLTIVFVVGRVRSGGLFKASGCFSQMADSLDKFAFVRDKDGNIDWGALYFRKGTSETQRMLFAMETNHVAPIRSELQGSQVAVYKAKCDTGDAASCNLLGEWNSVTGLSQACCLLKECSPSWMSVPRSCTPVSSLPLKFSKSTATSEKTQKVA